MPNVTFRQRDLAAAIKTARAAGLPIARIEVRPDGVHLIIGEPQPAAARDRWCPHRDRPCDDLCDGSAKDPKNCQHLIDEDLEERIRNAEI